MASGIRSVTERSGEGVGKPILNADNGEELMLVQHDVSIVLGSSRRAPESPGTLYITSRLFELSILIAYFIRSFAA